MRTISRAATRQIAAIKERVATCQMRSIRHNFAPVDVEPQFAWRDLADYHDARLTEMADGHWRIQIHGNLWYDLRAA